MKTTNADTASKPRRRRGSLAAELARDAQVSLYKAKQAIKLRKEAPELVPYIISGEVTAKDCIRYIKLQRQRPEPELTFEEEVEKRFKRWLSRWPKEDRRDVVEVIEMLPYQELFAVENDHEPKEAKKQ